MPILTSSYPSPIVSDLSRLKQNRSHMVLLPFALLWMLYMVSGFRSPLQEITLSDENASGGIRQLLFASAGLFSGLMLYRSQAIGSALVARLPYVLFAALLVASALWSHNPTLTVKRSIIFVFGILLQIALVHSAPKPVAFMLKTVCYFCMASAILSLLLHVALPAAHTVNPARPGLAGISNHPNTFAPFMSIGFVLSLGLSPRPGLERKLTRAGQGALLLASLLAASVTVWAATLVCLGLYAFLASNPYRRGTIQIAILSAVTLVSAVGFKTVKSELFDAAGRDESLSGRDELWAIVWEKAKDEILIGHGFGAFWTEGKGRELVQTWNPRQSHNAYLDVVVDLGAIGLLLTLALFPLSLLGSWAHNAGLPGSPRRKACSAMMAAALGYIASFGLSQSFFLRYDIFPFFILVWITLLFTNSDSNRLSAEFATQATSPSRPS